MATPAAPMPKQAKNKRFPFSLLGVTARKYEAYAEILPNVTVPTIRHCKQSSGGDDGGDVEGLVLLPMMVDIQQARGR